METPTPKLETARPRSGLRIAAVCAAVLLVALAIAAAWIVLSNNAAGGSNAGSAASATSGGGQAADAQTGGLFDTENGAISDIQASSAAQSRNRKLDGATETVDENGIVHGTTPSGISYLIFGRDEQAFQQDKVTFAALGDVLITDNNIGIVDRYAGSYGDGVYDCQPYYQGVRDQVAQYDLRLINQETICTGFGDGYSFSGYPVFNSPETIAYSILAEGYNIVNLNTNHTWDMGEDGIVHTRAIYAEYPQVMLVGSYASYDDRAAVRLIERNGMDIAFLSYCYGDNHYGADPGNFPNTYYTCPFDTETMAAEIARAKQVADAVVVYMHWGSEYTTVPNEQQEWYAKWLADQGVSLVVGSHAHILQPARYITGDSGNTVLVMYGLSDFISGWTLTDTIISGMFTCDFVRGDGGEVQVANPQFYPAIEWSDGGDVYVRFLKDMSDGEIASNTRTEDVGDDLGYLHSFIDGLGMEIPVVW